MSNNRIIGCRVCCLLKCCVLIESSKHHATQMKVLNLISNLDVNFAPNMIFDSVTDVHLDGFNLNMINEL